MWKIVICDDDADIAQDLANRVNDHFQGDCAIQQYQSADELRQAMDEGEGNANIALLDIELGEESGIKLAKELFPTQHHTMVIFITGFIEYCTDVYEAEHIYFLLKPIKTEQLERALHKAVGALKSTQMSFAIRVNGESKRIVLSDVFYIESSYRKLRICLGNEIYETTGSIAGLPAEVRGRMIQCHKSYLINPEHVRTFTGEQCVMDNGREISVSRSNRTRSRREYLDYLAARMEER
ncbi:MAG: LytTR family DNA-binding domain-containing protein [Oscillospiraceae bacterium]|nr:LytTR family DNA-binding domain-containing protein [Oscillospiraceae bacterium]